MAITWDDTYSVGIEEIDNQHKVLVGLINELDDALRVHSNREMVQGVIDQLIDYTKLHFAVEESIMRLFKYKEYEPHKAVHDGIIDKLNGMNEKFMAGIVRWVPNCSSSCRSGSLTTYRRSTNSTQNASRKFLVVGCWVSSSNKLRIRRYGE
ncbi:bacteriohemerythrin [Candidatus Reidiella endopervernicosa]|uniref:Hemerythrin family protein n=1 Tax=Candidatus Reidiella endopervernicosa TaxID=2738883 RepID=A0A6N0HT49_9GAMM|nr:bacteriohemerythrin [Candidatus Reidiella endopervernicosa]QKQ25563.1 hemerythrin family protein [Candidatus Reidiella endopervernicosa]